jgi:hypothetical protein
VISKDPDAHVGRKIVLHGHVTQFDSNTGSDAFRADTAGSKHSEWYDYDVNTVVMAENAASLSDVVVDDLVTMHAEIVGSLTYDTTMGGSMTVPQVRVNLIDVTGSTT